jgi:hypothetical protein
VLVVLLTGLMLRRGAFGPRVVVELRDDRRAAAQSMFAVTAAGKPLAAGVRLEYASGSRAHEASTGDVTSFPLLRRATFDLGPTGARELKVWAHRVTRDGHSESLAAHVQVANDGAAPNRFDMQQHHGQVLLPLNRQPCQIVITLSGRA